MLYFVEVDIYACLLISEQLIHYEQLVYSFTETENSARSQYARADDDPWVFP